MICGSRKNRRRIISCPIWRKQRSCLWTGWLTAPDVWFSPDSTGQKGRPYPYMIFRNMEALGLMDVRRVIKVGDTVSDIREGKNAGVLSAGIVTGSSEMGLSLEEFEALSPEEREEQCRRTEEKFLAAGADRVYRTLYELAESL